MEIVMLLALIGLVLHHWSLQRDVGKLTALLASLQGRYDNLERSGVSLFAKHNELRDRLDAIAPQPKKEQADVLGRSEAERNEVIGRAALHLLEGKP